MAGRANAVRQLIFDSLVSRGADVVATEAMVTRFGGGRDGDDEAEWPSCLGISSICNYFGSDIDFRCRVSD